MKILQIIYSLGTGGAERFVVDLSNELVKKNELFLISFYKVDSLFINNLDKKIIYICLELERGFNFKAIKKIQKLIYEIKPEIVHCHLSVVLYLAPLTILYPSVKFVHTIHSDALKEPGTKFQKFVRKQLYKFSLIKPVTISPSCHSSFLNFYNTKNAVLIYNGRSKILPTYLYGTCKLELIDKLKDANDIVFIHVARYNILKNQEILVKVFNQLINENAKISLLIIGPGFDSKEGIILKNLAKKNIHFLGAKANVTDYMYLSDAFCLPSFYEGMPISLIEAFATGCIPICTPTNGANDTIINGVTGYLSKDFTEEEYYKTVKQFIDSKSKINRNSLIEYYNQNFTIEVCAQKYVELFMDLINNQYDKY